MYKLSTFVCLLHLSNFNRKLKESLASFNPPHFPMDSQSHNQKPSAQHTHKASPSDLLSSAKVVADAAKSTLRHESNKVDKGRIADAAADLLCAASHYGKLEEKKYGKYVEKAETYLHKYNASHSAADSTTASSHSSSMHSSEGAHSEGGFGKYMKMAEGVLKKH